MKYHALSTTRSILGLIGFLLAAMPVDAAIYKVGSDGGCTHPTLPLALLAAAINPGLDEIQLPKNLTYTGEFFIESSVHLKGGFDTCSDTTPSGQTTVTRAATDRVLTVQNTPGLVILEDLNLNFTGGSTAVLNEGGMIHLSGADNILLLQHTSVANGRAGDGGGIFVEDARLILADHSLVAQNRASFSGGGIFCSGGQVELQSGGVAVNEANFGGGIALSSGCTGFAWGSAPFEGIYQNQAHEDGGGLHLIESSDFELLGDDQYAALLSANTATRGGGAYAVGSGSDLVARNAHIVDNEATEFGGGVYLGEFGYLFVERTLGRGCHDPDRCSSLSRNEATGASSGGGAVFIEGGYGHINQTYLEGNAAALFGTVVGLADGNSQLYMEGSVVAGNFPLAGSSLIYFGEDASVRLRFITFGNNEMATMFRGSDGESNTLEVRSSILYDQGGTFIYDDGTLNPVITFDCVLYGGPGFPPGTVTRARNYNPTANPLFVDSASGNYHLVPGAEAQDFCDTSVFVPLYGDIDAEPRGYNDLLADWWGPFDVGADELQEPPLFADGFESGDTMAWDE